MRNSHGCKAINEERLWALVVQSPTLQALPWPLGTAARDCISPAKLGRTGLAAGPVGEGRGEGPVPRPLKVLREALGERDHPHGGKPRPARYGEGAQGRDPKYPEVPPGTTKGLQGDPGGGAVGLDPQGNG